MIFKEKETWRKKIRLEFAIFIWEIWDQKNGITKKFVWDINQGSTVGFNVQVLYLVTNFNDSLWCGVAKKCNLYYMVGITKKFVWDINQGSTVGFNVQVLYLVTNFNDSLWCGVAKKCNLYYMVDCRKQATSCSHWLHLNFSKFSSYQ